MREKTLVMYPDSAEGSKVSNTVTSQQEDYNFNAILFLVGGVKPRTFAHACHTTAELHP